MTSGSGGRAHGDPQETPLGRVTGVAYWYVVVSALLILTVLPGLVPLAFLDRSASNAPLAALCLLPVGPALSASLFALHQRTRTDGLIPARMFARGYRLNVVDALRVWAPVLIVLTVIAISLGNLDEAGVPGGYAGVLVVVGALVLAWAMHALVITSIFNFRGRDVARLAAHYLGRLPWVTLGTVSLLVLAAGIVFLTFDAVLVLLGGVWAGMLLHNDRRMIRDVEAAFTDS